MKHHWAWHSTPLKYQPSDNHENYNNQECRNWRTMRILYRNPFISPTVFQKSCAHFSSNGLWCPKLFVQSYYVRLGLDEKDWTKSFGPKPVGRKGVGRKVGLPLWVTPLLLFGFLDALILRFCGGLSFFKLVNW